MKSRTKFALISFVAVLASGIILPAIPDPFKTIILAALTGVYLIAISIYASGK